MPSINKSFYFYLKIRKDFTIISKNAFLMIIRKEDTMSKKYFVLIVSIIFAGALFPPLSSVTAAQGEAVIATDEMNVRSGPGLSYGITAEAKKESAIRF